MIQSKPCRPNMDGDYPHPRYVSVRPLSTEEASLAFGFEQGLAKMAKHSTPSLPIERRRMVWTNPRIKL